MKMEVKVVMMMMMMMIVVVDHNLGVKYEVQVRRSRKSQAPTNTSRDRGKNPIIEGEEEEEEEEDEEKEGDLLIMDSFERKSPWDTSSLLPVEMVEHLRRGIGSMGQIVHVEEIEARKAVYADVPYDFLEKTKAAVEGIGISRLYSHQAEAVQASLSGKNVVVATSTSSGKSLCYNLPVLEALSQDPLSCALYLFPTKALAQDQLRALLGMTEGLGFKLNIGVYDGDTPQEDRRWLRDNARLLITNPDMLHVDPSFIFSTATSANPREHAMELANVQTAELIENDGSPCGPKTFLLWNPPPCLKTALKFPSSMTGSKSAYEGVARRSSPILEVSFIFAEFIQHGLRCIAFCKTRKLSELVLCYTREILQETAPHLVNSICAYRGGYTAQGKTPVLHPPNLSVVLKLAIMFHLLVTWAEVLLSCWDMNKPHLDLNLVGLGLTDLALEEISLIRSNDVHGSFCRCKRNAACCDPAPHHILLHSSLRCAVNWPWFVHGILMQLG
ncbi:hypothetical protein ACLOJK_038137 [Asimina triloba]